MHIICFCTCYTVPNFVVLGRMSEWVGFNDPVNTLQVISETKYRSTNSVVYKSRSDRMGVYGRVSKGTPSDAVARVEAWLIPEKHTLPAYVIVLNLVAVGQTVSKQMHRRKPYWSSSAPCGLSRPVCTHTREVHFPNQLSISLLPLIIFRNASKWTFNRASASASMQSAILLYHFCLSVCHVVALRLNEYVVKFLEHMVHQLQSNLFELTVGQQFLS